MERLMQAPVHRFSDLFAQLGLAHDAASIEAFLLSHSPLPQTMRLEEAPCWNPAQAALLREELRADADWAELVDQLNAALR